MNNQATFDIKKEVIIKDENKKWEKLKYDLKDLRNRFKAGTIINEVSNEGLINRILNRMEKYERREL